MTLFPKMGGPFKQPDLPQYDNALSNAAAQVAQAGLAQIYGRPGGAYYDPYSTYAAQRAGQTRIASVPDVTLSEGRTDLIAARLRIREADRLPWDALFTHIAGEKVFVFIVANGDAVKLEDELGLFPSDTLITQLRLLLP